MRKRYENASRKLLRAESFAHLCQWPCFSELTARIAATDAGLRPIWSKYQRIQKRAAR